MALKLMLIYYSFLVKACVKRRVVNSMTGTNTNCSKIAATIAMEVVWDTCYNDTAPFDKAT